MRLYFTYFPSMELQGNLWVKIRREAKGERLNWIGDWG